ncbi:hypothetical protein M9Y10_019138 [Tritrichomonas musculus]|uniref:Uncharacterized protein n=1 Tax=Tritrichomonas musculus TaxID=1915356 RepID=A0ABR2HIL2_9EUKA
MSKASGSNRLSVKNFVETLLNTIRATTKTPTSKMYVYLDSKIYPNEFGISVRPLQVKLGTEVINMQRLIDIFDKVPYITVKENRYRSVYREPMLMTIDLKEKQYNDTVYYEYYIDKLFLRNELTKYNKIYTNAHEIITKYKQSHVSQSEVCTTKEVQSIEEFNEVCKTNEFYEINDKPYIKNNY